MWDRPVVRPVGEVDWEPRFVRELNDYGDT